MAQSTPVPAIPAADGALVLDKDYSWKAYVTAAYGTPEYGAQRLTCILWAETVKKATADGKAGKYDDVISQSPLSRQRAWAALNKLRVMMGGVKQDDGSWKGYKADSDGLFSGTDAELKACIDQANLVLKYVKSAVDSKTNKDMNGLDCQDAAKWAQSYLDGILQVAE